MKKEDLRKVKISKHSDGSGEKIRDGLFHEWTEIGWIGDDNRTVAVKHGLIELQDGTMKVVLPACIKFED